MWVDQASAAKGLLARPLRPAESGATSPRRFVYLSLLLLTLYLGVFQVLSLIGLSQDVELDGIASWQLFSLHFVFVCFLVSHWLLSQGASVLEGDEPGDRRLEEGREVSRARSWATELLLGTLVGAGLWAAVLLTLLLIGGFWSQLTGNEPSGEVPAMVEWIGTQPLALRLAVALSAGVVEETFFRGYLQARVGVLASTLLFVVAHFSYGQPLLLVGVSLLSLAFAALVVWRRSVLAAIAAHTVFDVIQLVVVIPTVLGALEVSPSNDS